MKVLFWVPFIVALYTLAFDGIEADLSEQVSNKNSDIYLDGMIGPYDPNDSGDNPNFEGLDEDELEGNIPNNYYTIAVTVPTNMYFTVAHGGSRGVFCSPEYTIKNQATRTIYVSVVKIEIRDEEESNDFFSKLYLRTPTPMNGDIEIEVYLSLLNNTTQDKIALMLSDSFNEKYYLGKLGLKESGTLKFESDKWDAPGLDEYDSRHAKIDFILSLEFSLDAPNYSKEL